VVVRDFVLKTLHLFLTKGSSGKHGGVIGLVEEIKI